MTMFALDLDPCVINSITYFESEWITTESPTLTSGESLSTCARKKSNGSTTACISAELLDKASAPT